MLRGRSPWGLGGAVYLLVRYSFAFVHLFINMRSSMLSIIGQGDVIEYCVSMLDRTGAPDRRIV
jgi:hypothetical protein